MKNLFIIILLVMVAKGQYGNQMEMEQINILNCTCQTNNVIGLKCPIINMPEIRVNETVKCFGQKTENSPANCIKPWSYPKNSSLLENIPSKLFANLPNLKEIRLQKCNISEIPKNLFSGSTKLDLIYLHENFISELPETLFKDAKELRILKLDFNNIDNLQKEIFYENVKLESLNLSHNKLEYIHREVFSKLISLRELDLSFNKIQKMDDILWNAKSLEYLNLANNILNHYIISSDVILRNLKSFDLSNNFISELQKKLWSTLDSIEKLNLANNNITLLEIIDIVQLIESSTYLRKIDLSNNIINEVSFKHVDEHLMEFGAKHEKIEVKITELILENNPLNCDCKISELHNYLRKPTMLKEILTIVAKKLFCKKPAHLRNKPIIELSAKELKCKVEKIRHTNKMNDNCTIFLSGLNLLEVDCRNKNSTMIPDISKIIPTKYLNNYDIELNLQNNRIKFISEESWKNIVNVTMLNVGNNNITNMNLNKLSLNLKELRLDNNEISFLDKDSINFLNSASKLRNITLHKNPWKCNCEASIFLTFIHHNYNKIDKLNEVRCVTGQLMKKLTISDLCPYPKGKIISWACFISIAGVMIGLLIATFYRYNQEIKIWLYAHQMCLWFVTEEELDRDKQYDAFISYSHLDEEFVIKQIVPGLENGSPNYKLCLHYRDWVVGDYIPTQIARSVENSRRTIVILSPNFVDSVWGKMEFRTAHSQALKEGLARVIVILYGDIGPTDNLDPELKAYISMNTYIKWGDPWFWDRLRYALPHAAKPPKGIPMFHKNLSIRQNKPTLSIDKDDLIKGTDHNATPPATTTPPANKLY